jgi:hypothetical protein
MRKHIEKNHKDSLKIASLTLPKFEKRDSFYFLWIILGLVTSYVVGFFITTLLSLRSNLLLPYFSVVGLYVLLCIVLLSRSITRRKPLLRSFMIGALGLIPGLISQSLINEANGKSRKRYAVALIFCWLQTMGILVLTVLVLSFIV